jgi:type IV pilus assembly protein PilW
MILRDMRSGGFQGCGRPLVAGDFENMLLDPTTLTHNYVRAIAGYEGSSGTFSPAVDSAIVSPLAKSDIVVIRGVQPGVSSLRTTASMADGNAAVVVEKAVGTKIVANTPMMISNCERSTVFAATTVTDNGTTLDLLHAAGVSGVTNSSANIGAFLEGSLVSPLSTTVYYVRQDTGKPPALWRVVDNDAPVELVPGIERLELLYGEDTDGDQLADRYVTADTAGVNWDRITSASISVLVRSTEAYGGVAQKSKTFAMAGVSGGVTPGPDRFLHLAFSTTASLRNRTP